MLQRYNQLPRIFLTVRGFDASEYALNVYASKINNDNYSLIMQRMWRNATPFAKV